MAPKIDEEISFRKLEALLAFLDAGSLARAAEHLDTTPASIHRALHSLEKALRCSLFRQEGRNLQPTEAARVLASTARDVLRSMSEGVRATRAAAGYAADVIRIGSLYSLTVATVPKLVQGIKLRRPELQTELVLGSNEDLLTQLRAGSIDAALIAEPENAPDELRDLEAFGLFDDEILFAAPEGTRYAALEPLDLREGARETFVSLPDGFATYEGFVGACRLAGFKPRVAMTTNDIFSLMNLVAGGLGCTLLPGRVRSILPPGVVLVRLQQRYALRQRIALHFSRTRERDPNLLALLAVCRAIAQPLRSA